MKRTYVKLSSEFLSVQFEEGFMGCSVRLENEVTVEVFHNGLGSDDDKNPFEITFGE